MSKLSPTGNVIRKTRKKSNFSGEKANNKANNNQEIATAANPKIRPPMTPTIPIKARVSNTGAAIATIAKQQQVSSTAVGRNFLI